jgi:hypothetical protein
MRSRGAISGTRCSPAALPPAVGPYPYPYSEPGPTPITLRQVLAALLAAVGREPKAPRLTQAHLHA